MDDLEQQFERNIAHALADDAAAIMESGPARVLVAAAERHVRQGVEALLCSRAHQVTSVARLDEACGAAARQRFDAVIVGPLASEAEGPELLRLLQRTSPACKALVLARTVSAATAVQAMRCGAVDVLALPLEPSDFLQRIDSALLKASADRQRDHRLARLKRICRELNLARHEISKQVDSLCDDLAHVYEDVAEQMNDVAMAAEFRTLLRQELDVEELLRTTLEYLLTKTGPTNAAVFLPDGSALGSGGAGRGGHAKPAIYGLGAYVNYDCPRETVSAMLDHLGNAVCPQMSEEGEIVRFDDAADFAQWVGGDAECLADCQVIAFSCRHKGDCLGVIVLFRKDTQPFPDKLAGTLETLRDIIAEQLRNVVKVHHRASHEWPDEAEDGDLDYGLSEGDDHYGFGSQEGGLAA
jgi:DNA-binding response OmpR family regulator